MKRFKQRSKAETLNALIAAANEGHYLERIKGMAREAGLTHYHSAFVALQSMYEHLSCQPTGAYEFYIKLGSELGSIIQYKFKYSKTDMAKLWWGLPHDYFESNNIPFPEIAGTDKQRSNT